MTKKRVFTYEECEEIAKKYNNRRDFHTKDKSCFKYSRQMGWYDSITKHIKTKSPKHRTYEEVLNAAKQYKTRMEFKNSDMANYSYAVTHGWLDDVCSHMRLVGDLYKRCIYVYELPNKICYIGLTYNLEQRHTQHCNKKMLSAIRSYCEQNSIEIPKPKQLTEYIDSKTASKLEGEFLEKYKNDGWHCLNVSKTGGLGGNKHLYRDINIDIDTCKDAAMKCENQSEFEKKYRSLYRIAKQNGWLEYVFSHFDREAIKEKVRKAVSNANKCRKRDLKVCREAAYRCGASKPVLQYDLDGNLIKEYMSQSDAAKALGHPKSHTDIGRCCKGRLKTSCGYVWKYKENNISKVVLK